MVEFAWIYVLQEYEICVCSRSWISYQSDLAEKFAGDSLRKVFGRTFQRIFIRGSSFSRSWNMRNRKNCTFCMFRAFKGSQRRWDELGLCKKWTSRYELQNLKVSFKSVLRGGKFLLIRRDPFDWNKRSDRDSCMFLHHSDDGFEIIWDFHGTSISWQ